MSSDERHQSGSGQSADHNKRRRPNACDMCRKRKIRCDGRQVRTGKCTNCTVREWDCEFGSFVAKGKYSGYIEALEVKVKRLESLIRQLLPGRDFTKEVGYELTRDNWMMPGVCGTSTLDDPEEDTTSVNSVMPTPPAARSDALSVLRPDHAPPLTPPVEDDHMSDEESSITTKLQQLPTMTSATTPNKSILINYMGRSSSAALLKTAIALCSRLAPHVDSGSIFERARKRPDWLNDLGKDQPQVQYSFPDPDVQDELVDLYFLQVHTFAPILHRPTFERDRKAGLHLHDRTFGGVVLLVCALAARFSDKQRASAEHEKHWHTLGWQWFSQVSLYDVARMIKPNSHLHGLQILCLGVMYSMMFSHVHAWIHVGLGIRLALDIGAHKRRAYGVTPTLDDELYKRNFWMLHYLDRTLSSMMGRPCCIQEEDFDLELPLCCDDEYLVPEDTQKIVKQPEDKPSYTGYFISILKLCQIQGLALRTMYASTKARTHYNFQGKDWTSRTIAHLDSLLNNWADSIPDHLRWDPKRENDLFFCQSAHLHLEYQKLRIMVHRQFLGTFQLTACSSPALTICMNASRSIVHLVTALIERVPGRTTLVRWDAAYAAMVMLVGVGIARLNNLTSFDRKRISADIESMLSVLRVQEDVWRCAGSYADALGVFMAICGDDSPDADPTRQRKRRHEDDTPVSLNPPTLPSESPAHDDLLRAELESPSIFTSAAIQEQTNVMDQGPDAAMSPSAGAFLGNINFGSLFGFGDASFEAAQTQPGVEWNSGVNRPAAGFNDNTSVNVGPEDWTFMSFDFGMGADWQWLTPAPEETGYRA
ncbi:unnamed protein product [Peniophora sp. CBMAI 1063]|nr:unnamed protein product [Peniophora sp. CBMAI 1063]